MAFVGFIEDDGGEYQVASAGSAYQVAFERTFARLAPMVTPFGAPNMCIQEKDISDAEAEELDAICAKYLG